MSESPVQSFPDLLARIDALIEDAESGPVDPVIVDYLRATRDRVELLRDRVAEGRRTGERYVAEGEARLVVKGTALPVEIRDRSSNGFGLLADDPVAPETYARLDIDGQYEEEIYEGLITHCRPEEDRYRLGLDIVSYLRIG